MNFKTILVLLISLLSLELHAQAIGDTKYGNNDPTNLTDQDKDLSNNFVHDQRVQRIYEEECTKDSKTEDACLGSKADPKVAGMKSSMISALAKAYTMIIGFGAGGELSTKSSFGDEAKAADTSATEGTDKAKDGGEDETKDYCKYIPVATEAIAMFNTTTEQKTIGMLPKSEATAQKESLLKAAENHETRAKTAKIQTTGWGASTVCYVASISMSAASWSSAGNIAKVAASALLTGFYMKQIGAHEDYAEKTRDIANKLPGKGDCNPITDKLCFCTEPTSKKRPDYDKYCRAHLHTRKIAYASERMTCIDENMKEDPACQCAVRETCIDKKVMTTIKGFGGLGSLSSPSFGDFKSLSNGELKSKSLSNAQTSLNNALAKLREVDKKLPANNSILSKKQRQEFNVLKSAGFPDNIAKKFAQMPLTPAAKKNIANFKNGFSNKSYSRRRSSRKKRSNVLTFSGGSGSKIRKKSSGSKSNNFLKRFGLKKKRRKKASGKVLKFANRAQQRAQISRSSEKVIFDIISRRYQVSGWRRLEYIK
ncbi:hypothetical protein A9Q84_18500 [Halobacteriovorax marinus]|uniref:Uncharacterized protein n=1 Tax=Halobacteriovorax marinus TaxID=97084 RepID=A0A1Y5F201_9BACT|nr:hypothetical protein A9Q84_18500 [Halobacteriovorax marinus]